MLASEVVLDVSTEDGSVCDASDDSLGCVASGAAHAEIKTNIIISKSAAIRLFIEWHLLFVKRYVRTS